MTPNYRTLAVVLAVTMIGAFACSDSNSGRATERAAQINKPISDVAEKQKAAIELVKASRGSAIVLGPIWAQPPPITYEEDIRRQVEALKGDLRIIGWQAWPYGGLDIWLVEYVIEMNGQSKGWPFEVHLAERVVRRVIGDPVLEKKYGYSSSDGNASRPPRTNQQSGSEAREQSAALTQRNGTTSKPTPPSTPVRVGGSIKAPIKTKDVRPQYPGAAQSGRVQGVVVVEATIGPDGKVQDARVLRSIPLLDEAALHAVRQWEFTPTVLNGVPVPVIMTVTVQFTLS